VRTTGKNALPRAQVAPVRHSFPHLYTFTHFLKVSVRALRASLPRPGLRPRPSRARGGQGASPARRIRGFEKRRSRLIFTSDLRRGRANRARPGGFDRAVARSTRAAVPRVPNAIETGANARVARLGALRTPP
jgi:hypothetical protein